MAGKVRIAGELIVVSFCDEKENVVALFTHMPLDPTAMRLVQEQAAIGSAWLQLSRKDLKRIIGVRVQWRNA